MQVPSLCPLWSLKVLWKPSFPQIVNSESSQEAGSERQTANTCALKYDFLKASFPAASADAH